jgi:hypothetical protein
LITSSWFAKTGVKNSKFSANGIGVAVAKLIKYRQGLLPCVAGGGDIAGCKVAMILSDGVQDDGASGEGTATSVVRSRRIRDRFSFEDLLRNQLQNPTMTIP